jgi:hypothetical protein
VHYELAGSIAAPTKTTASGQNHSTADAWTDRDIPATVKVRGHWFCEDHADDVEFQFASEEAFPDRLSSGSSE